MKNPTATDPGMRYVLAREAINQEISRLMSDRIQEQEKTEPCATLLKYFDMHMVALESLWTSLSLKDTAAIDAIMDGVALTRIQISKEVVNA